MIEFSLIAGFLLVTYTIVLGVEHLAEVIREGHSEQAKRARKAR